MKLDFDSIKPVYVQIAEMIEDDIVSGKLKDGENAYSQISISKELNVNPSTAGKGINLLVQKGILIKKRGLSMVVSNGAKDFIIAQRRDIVISSKVEDLIIEAEKLGINQNELLTTINKFYDRRKHQ